MDEVQHPNGCRVWRFRCAYPGHEDRSPHLPQPGHPPAIPHFIPRNRAIGCVPVRLSENREAGDANGCNGLRLGGSGWDPRETFPKPCAEVRVLPGAPTATRDRGLWCWVGRTGHPTIHPIKRPHGGGRIRWHRGRRPGRRRTVNDLHALDKRIRTDRRDKRSDPPPPSWRRPADFANRTGRSGVGDPASGGTVNDLHALDKRIRPDRRDKPIRSPAPELTTTEPTSRTEQGDPASATAGHIRLDVDLVLIPTDKREPPAERDQP